MMRARSLAVPLALSGALLLTACGDDGTTTAAPTSTAGNTQGGPGGGPGFGGQDFQKIQECLSAAGISLPTPSGGFQPPTGTPSGRPQGTPPSGAPGDGGGPGGGMFADPQVQAALQACGITVPTGRPRPSGTASPTT
jgi:hypothetical protein